MMDDVLESIGDFNYTPKKPVSGARFEVNNKIYVRKMNLKRENSGYEERDGVFLSIDSNKTRSTAIEKIKRSLLCLSDKGDFQSVIATAVDYENTYLAMPSKSALTGLSPDVLLSKIATLSDARNTFLDACKSVDSIGKEGKRIAVYGSEINIRMPVLSDDICDALKELHMAECRESLRTSPISKPEAPMLRGPIDAIPYSKGESPKAHLATRKARASLLEINQYGAHLMDIVTLILTHTTSKFSPA